ncbi:hypothetical protein CC78DRAFT_583560 [Lojkania enalia]|uniref:Uncharacterized protein n=1 Tax=Lojkania enalia TaxID=147567 RepID=A0A9P4K5A1_9PLEO|nr:hypothetical protein CC78DRAFT_583560 [Didymosphaeria enalia]
MSGIISAVLAGMFITSHLVLCIPANQPRQDEDRLSQYLPDLYVLSNHGEYFENDFTTEEKRLDIWRESNAGFIAEKYLQNNAYENWAHDMWKILFPERSPSQMSCVSEWARCSIGTMPCSDFEATGWSGTFYIYVSLDNFDQFFQGYVQVIDWLRDDLTDDVGNIIAEFKAEPHEKEESFNPFSILALILNIGAGTTVTNLAVTGTLGTLAAFSELISEINKKPGKIGKDMKNDMTKVLLEFCDADDDIPSEANIPEAMKKDSYSSYTHALVKAMGDGQWLVDHPTAGLPDDAEHLRKLLDPDKQWCFGMMYLVDDGSLDGGINDLAYSLWDNHGMDKLTTYRNAYDCWIMNPTASLKPSIMNNDPQDTSLPKCFFGMEIKKGEYFRPAGYRRAWIKLDRNLPNYPGEPETWPDGWWPPGAPGDDGIVRPPN